MQDSSRRPGRAGSSATTRPGAAGGGRGTWRRTVLACTVAMLIAAPSAVAAEAVFGFPASEGDVAAGENLDLLNATIDTIRFHYAQGAPAANESMSSAWVELRLGTNESIDVLLAKTTAPNGNVTWDGELAFDERDLVVGSWNATVRGVNQAGNVITPTDARTLSIIAPGDQAGPQLSIAGDEDGVVELGVGDTVNIVVTDQLLRWVQYRTGPLPEFLRLTAPYVLGTGVFAEGVQILTVHAKDRAGFDAEPAFVVVDKDTTEPELDVGLPDIFYKSIPNDVRLNVSDAHAYTWRVKFGANETFLGSQDKVAGTRVHVVPITPNATGDFSLSIEVIDRFGNAATALRSVTVVAVTTDISLKSADLETERPIANETVRFNVRVVQESGVTDMPVNVTVEGADVAAQNVTVPLGGDLTVAFDARLPAGQHTLTLHAQVPEGVNETDADNDDATIDVEVFMGRVEHDGDMYYIRVGEGRLPDEAVDEEDKTYALTFRDTATVGGRQLSSVYTFDVAGERLYWDPAEAVTVMPEPAEEPEGGDGGADNPIPVPLWLAPLALAGLAAWRRR